jgi:hypothetical protein
MNNSLKMFGLVAVTLGLSGCSTCMKSGDYDKVPYTPNRTAGTGHAVFGTACEAEPVPVVEAPAQPAAAPAPAPQPANDVFMEKQSK